MSYRFAEHGGEVEVELESSSAAGLFEAALEAFVELVSLGEQGPTVERQIELGEHDRALLLVDWLNELLFLAEVERFVPERLASLELDDGSLRASVVGTRGAARQLVKAVTLNRLELGQEGEGWHARVVLDV